MIMQHCALEQRRFVSLFAMIWLLCLLSVYSGSALANSIANQGAAEKDYPVFPKPPSAGNPQQQARIEHGEYLIKIADCMACHTDQPNHGEPFAGGFKMEIPLFGSVYTSNLTPDKDTGIGNWSDDDFVRAVREGISPDGSYYLPVFPYNYFSMMSREDVLDIKAYLDTVPAVNKENRPLDFNWPFGYRFLQFGWRLLFFDFEEQGFKKDSSKSDAWNRGAFIVEGPGHCALCHTELNLMGVPKDDYLFAGAFVEGYYAPDISARGFKHLDKKAVADIFLHGKMSADTPLGGPMADVEHNSLRYLKREDMLAIAEYLKSVESESPPVEDIGGEPLGKEAGKKLYVSRCMTCHQIAATDAPKVDDRFAWEVLLDQGKDRLYEITIKGSGDMPPKGGCRNCSDERLKAAVNYMIELAAKASADQQIIQNRKKRAKDSASSPGRQIAEKGNNNGAAACVGCHGLNGEGNQENGFPRLAGLDGAYLTKQLQAYQEKQRTNVTMSPIAEALKVEEINALASYYSSLKPGAGVKQQLDVNTKPGKELAIYGDYVNRGLPACNQCHGSDGQGVDRHFPPLAGQPYSYIVQQLKDWKAGRRTGDPDDMMRVVADKLSLQEIESAAAYYALINPLAVNKSSAQMDKMTKNDTVYSVHTGEVPHHGDAPEARPVDASGYFRAPPRSKFPEGPFGDAVRLGEDIFVNTKTHTLSSPFVGNQQNCEGCHLDAGRLMDSSPMWASWVAYPAYRKKNKHVNTMIERIQGCFKYSMNAQGSKAGHPPSAESDVMVSLVSYFYWLATGAPTGDQHMAGRGYGSKLKETAKGFEPGRGKVVYEQKCAICHAQDGQGKYVNGQIVFPALWGRQSYNWGAGMHKIDMAGGFIKHNMPLGLPNTLSDQDVWDVSAYINSFERPQDPRYKGNLQQTTAKFHKSKFDYYGKRKQANGKLLGQDAPK